MLKICIVEDDGASRDKLTEYIGRFCAEYSIEYNIDWYGDGLQFLEEYKPVYNLIFMDIQLPNIDGMTTARRLREIDGQVGIIFVTNLLKYAIHGYEVHAFDYIVKPVDYFDFSVRMRKFVGQALKEGEPNILLSSGGKIRRVSVREICYVDVAGHSVCYHLTGGEDVRVHGSMASAEQMLPRQCFVKCNSGILVNLYHVQTLERDEVLVAGQWLPISRPKKKEFVAAVTKFIASPL